MSTILEQRATIVRLDAPRRRVNRFLLRAPETLVLAIVSLALICGVELAFQAKIADQGDVSSAVNISAEIDESTVTALFMETLHSEPDAAFGARIWLTKASRGGAEQTGSLSKVSVSAEAIRRARPALRVYRERLEEVIKRHPHAVSVPLLSAAEIQTIHSRIVVRTEAEYLQATRMAAIYWLIAIWGLHFLWIVVAHRGSLVLLPAVAALTGIGMAIMVSLQDPLRDRILSLPFSHGVAEGAVIMAAASLINYERWTARLALIPLAVAAALVVLLALFGSGPEDSGVKVNLGPCQPSELVKVLLVFGLAGLFRPTWRSLRLFMMNRHKVLGLAIPRPMDMLPIAAVIPFVAMFLFLRDTSVSVLCLAVLAAMWAAARHRWQLLVAGVAMFAAGLWGALRLAPHMLGNVQARLDMWAHPWENMVRGGDHAAQFLWTIAAGGYAGSGLGLSYARFLQNAVTDGVIAAWAEQTGLAGVIVLLAIYGVLFAAMFRIARSARTEYLCFLGLGLTVLLAAETVWIAAAILNLAPLSGIVSPFLSFGKSAMIVNFAIIGVIASISAGSAPLQDKGKPFHLTFTAMRWVVSGALVVIVFAAARYQVWSREATTLRTAQTREWRSLRPATVENPRLAAAAAMIPRGEIFDVNGVPICAASLDRLAPYTGVYRALGIGFDNLNPFSHHVCPAVEFLFHILGDARRGALMQADRQVERGFDAHLRGWNSPAELLPLVWNRYDDSDAGVRRLLDRDRNVHLSLDLRWQVLASRIIETMASEKKYDRFGFVAIDPSTGGILASVSYPWPGADRALGDDSADPALGAPGDHGAAGRDSGAPAHIGNVRELHDNARVEMFQPGSGFKTIVALAKLVENRPEWTYTCVRMPHGRNGCLLPGIKHPILDDLQDRNPHGTVGLEDGFAHSCNCYFASLGFLDVGIAHVGDMASQFGIRFDSSRTGYDGAQEMFGQGAVSASAQNMASVWAAIENGGMLMKTNLTADATPGGVRVVDETAAVKIEGYGRAVVTRGTAAILSKNPARIIGKTGTAQNTDAQGKLLKSHSWFAGAAPYRGSRKVAFAAVAPNSGYGAAVATPVAGRILETAIERGLIK